MANAFSMARVGDAVWPEAIGVLGVGVGHAVSRGLDGAWGLNKPFRRVSDWAHIAAIGGAGYMIATGRSVDTAKAILYADSGLLASTFGDMIYASAVGKRRPSARRLSGSTQRAVAGAPTARLLNSGRGAAVGVGTPVGSVIEI